MAKIPGTIPLGGTIAPTDSEDVYATHIANYGLGGLHHVDTIAERDAITAERRVEGMLCTVADSDGAGKPAIYQLIGGTENTNWEEFSGGKDGKSAYQVAVDEGFPGTVTEWLDSLKGEDGSDHGDPDVIGAYAWDQSFTKDGYNSVNLIYESQKSGGDLVLNSQNGTIACQRAGTVLIVARLDSNFPTAPESGGHTLFRVRTEKSSGDGSIAFEVGDYDSLTSQMLHVLGAGMVQVEAGTSILAEVCPDSNRTGNVFVTAAYLSANGLSAYEIAKKHGFAGSEESWLLGLTDHRSPGEIVSSLLPLADPRLVQLDGAVLATDGVYSETIASVIVPLATSHPNLFVTEAAWQQSVSTYGVCGKFVLDTTAGTLRLPKVSGFIQGTLDEQSIGDLVEAGLPNITGHLASRPISGTGGGAIVNSSGVFSFSTKTGTGSISPVTLPSSGSYKADITNFSAASSNSTYGKSSTVQPQAIKVYVYMVFASAVKTPALVDAENYVNDLNTMRQTMPALAARAAMPSAQRIALSVPANGGTITAPADGYLYFGNAATAVGQAIVLTNTAAALAVSSSASAASEFLRVLLPVRGGDTITFTYTAAGTNKTLNFIYANGSAPE